MKKQSIFFLCLALSTILSAQVSKTVNCTAGALSSLLSSTEKSTVTDLTLTGTIDARDFFFMRDNMPKLANIDMGTVIIVAYQNNLDNQIPAFSFNDTVYHITNTTLTSFVMPSTTTSIGDRAFTNCHGFTGILTIPNSVTSIGDMAFYNCSGFTGIITIPNSVKSIGVFAFSGCNGISILQVDINNPNYSSEDGILYNKDKTKLIQCPAGKSGSLTIPISVTSIGDMAFARCSRLTGSLTIPNSVKSIGNSVFIDCSGFTGSLTIPNSVTSIGSEAFSSCSGFTGNITIPNSVKSIGDMAFFNCRGLTGSLTIPNSVTSIGKEAFSRCKGLTGSLTIPNSVTSIERYAFAYCSGLTGNLTIPNSVTSIGDAAFISCEGLTGITIPNSVTSIGGGAFYGWTGLRGSLTIPNSVTCIGEDALNGCTGLTGITIPNSVTSIGHEAFAYCSGLSSIKEESLTPVDLTTTYQVFRNVNKSTCTLYVPKGSKSAYQSATQWKDFLNIVEYDDIATGINDITATGTSLYVSDVQLHIKNAPVGETLSITAISGMPIYSGIITTDVVSVSLPMSGVYIVTIGNKSQKVVY